MILLLEEEYYVETMGSLEQTLVNTNSYCHASTCMHSCIYERSTAAVAARSGDGQKSRPTMFSGD